MAVKDAAAFKKMRQYLVHYYTDCDSIYDPSGIAFDCVPIRRQPGLRLQGKKGVDTSVKIKNLLIADKQAAGATVYNQGSESWCGSGTIPPEAANA